MKQLDRVTQIARVCHEANRAYCESMGDQSQMPWDLAPGWQQQSARTGVENIENGTVTKPSDSHESWLAEKERDGWTFGVVKDAKKKTHPCFVPYAQLPPEQKMKDYIFFAIASAMLNGPK